MSVNPPQDYRSTDKTHRTGLAADRPTAADVLPGTLYFSTDTAVLERSDGSTWSSYSGGGGAPGAPGPIGPMSLGIPGQDGQDGEDGFIYPPGKDGTAGSPGATGNIGFSGTAGVDGLDGEIGEDGIQGPIGPTGNIGPIGNTGSIGPIGLPGIDGDDGLEALPIPGPVGNTGATGIQGIPGVSNVPGPMGPSGIDAEESEYQYIIPGPRGIQGIQGIQGNPGTGGGSSSPSMPFVIDADELIENILIPPPQFDPRIKENIIVGGSAAAQNSITAATLTYITGSNIPIPSSKLRLNTLIEWVIKASKTAVGTAATTFHVRLGTLGTTGDAAIHTFALGVGTAVADEFIVKIRCFIRGPLGAACISNGVLELTKTAAGVTGIVATTGQMMNSNSAGFDSTVANLIAGISVTSGATVVLSVQQVTWEARNL